MRGTLFLVVGPSGAGKDALIKGARAVLERSGRFVFPARTITRSEPDASEDYVAEDRSVFERREQAGAFALTWRAHGLAYGIPIEIEQALAAGKHVVVNVSRGVVGTARDRFSPVRVIEVTAPAEVLAARLQARGRESSAQVAERLAREVPVQSDAVVMNDGPLSRAVEAFVRLLSEVESSGKAP